MEKTLIAVLLAASLALGVGLWMTHQQKELEMDFFIGVEEEVNENWLGLDEYFFVTNLYQDIFLRFGLVDKMTLDEKAEVLHKMFYNLSYDNRVDFIVKNYQKNKPLFVSLQLVDSKDGEKTIFLFSNYDARKGKVTTREADLENCFGYAYYIFGDKTVGYREKFSAEQEREYRETSLNNLGHMYLFDELAENDQYIEDVLFEGLHSTDQPVSKYINIMTLAQYFSSIDDEAGVEQALEEAKVLAENHTELQTGVYPSLYQATEEIYIITKFLREIK